MLVVAECLLLDFFFFLKVDFTRSHSVPVPDGGFFRICFYISLLWLDCHSNATKKCAYFRMEDIGAYKASTIFVSQPFTVYEVDFFDSWYDFGWLQNRQSLCLDFFSILQKVGCSTQILTNFFQTMISCFKAIPSFFSKKRSPQMNFLVFVYLTDWIFEYIFPS